MSREENSCSNGRPIPSRYGTKSKESRIPQLGRHIRPSRTESSTYTTKYRRGSHPQPLWALSPTRNLFTTMAEENDDETLVRFTMQQQEHDPPSLDHEPDSKRKKQEWLAFRGTRQSRVGADYQVTALPTPSVLLPTDATLETQEDHRKEESTYVVEPEADDSSSDDQPPPRQEQENSTNVDHNQQDHTG